MLKEYEYGMQGPPFDDEDDLTWQLDADSDDDDPAGDASQHYDNMREDWMIENR